MVEPEIRTCLDRRVLSNPVRVPALTRQDIARCGALAAKRALQELWRSSEGPARKALSLSFVRRVGEVKRQQKVAS